MKKIFSQLFLLFTSVNLSAQSVEGEWYGALEIQKTKLHIVFHIKKTGTGFSGTMDSPDQGVNGIGMDSTSFEHNRLVIEAKKLGMRYAAAYDTGAHELNGVFRQSKMEFPLVLKRTKEEVKVVRRAQDPVDFPYNQEEVAIDNRKDSLTLAGTLTMPKDHKADKIVILITGSGPQNRNEEIVSINHRPFLVWSDWLTRHGIAVLRYDDRGIGSSTGKFNKATSAGFANDVTAAIDFIKSRKDLEGLKIGLIGHSEGGMIAPMVAARDKRVAFIVLLAGPGEPIDELMVQQIAFSQSGADAPKNIADVNIETSKLAYSFLKKNAGKTNKEIEPELRKILHEQLAKYPPDAFDKTKGDEILDNEIKSYLGVWFRYFIAFIPADYLGKVKCPVLALNGTLDKQVSCKENLDGIDAALKKGKNKNFEIVPLQGLNHLFQKAETGDPGEYGNIEETVNPVALNKVTEWLGKLK